jgi:hypothetical protein
MYYILGEWIESKNDTFPIPKFYDGKLKSYMTTFMTKVKNIKYKRKEESTREKKESLKWFDCSH